MDNRFKLTLEGDGCHGFPSGFHYLLNDPVVVAFTEAGGVVEPTFSPEELAAFAKIKAIAEVAALELAQARTIREALLTGDMTRLKNIERQVAQIMGRNPVVQ